jgi:hypothetical protein
MVGDSGFWMGWMDDDVDEPFFADGLFETEEVEVCCKLSRGVVELSFMEELDLFM